MAKKIITPIPENRLFGYSRLSDGKHVIKKCACFQDSFTDNNGETKTYDVLALFVDTDEDELFLRLNNCWRPKPCKNEDGKTSIVKASGSLFDKLFTYGQYWHEVAAKINSELVGKEFVLEWLPYVSLDSSYSGFSWIPKADFVEP